MATITSLLKAATGNSQRGRNPYMVENTLDIVATTVDPSSGDVVQAITIPAGHKIMAAGVEVVESATMNTGTDATITLGAADADEYVTSFDIDGAADGAYAPSVTVSADVVLASDDTLDVTFAGSGASFTAGKLRVYAIMMDVSEQGDTSANEVDRDTLA
jgi:arginase family enzyme